MYNWSLDLKRLEKYPQKAILWKIEQAINFGLNKERLDKTIIKKYWKKLHIDPLRRKFLKFLLWPEKS
jgi:hypothetical protein